MTPTEDRVRKVLELERAKRFQDRAVTAGLDSFIRNVLANEASQVGEAVSSRLQSLPDGGYRGLGAAARRAWVEVVLREIGAARGGSPSNTNGAGRGEGGRRKEEDGGGPPMKTPSSIATGSARSVALREPARDRERPARQQHTRPYTREEIEALGVDAHLHALKRIGFSVKVKFEKLGVETVRDLLLLFPRRHVDYGEPVPVSRLEIGREQTVRVRVWSATERRMGPRMRSSEATVGDSSGMMTCVWFNQPWVAKQLPVNAEIVLSGRVASYQGRPKFDNPEWEPWSDDLLHTGRLVPIYPLTAGLQSRTVRRVMQEALERYVRHLPDELPEEMRRRLALAPMAEAVTEMHYPSSRAALERARRRLAFEELLPIQLTMQLRRRAFQKSAPAEPLPISAGIEREFVASLPFTLTSAQERVMFDVLNDMRKPVPMSRLVQGDVGSGKTVIAAAALVAAVENGRQGVMMAPTEILAEQHFRTLGELLGGEVTGGARLQVTGGRLQGGRGSVLAGEPSPPGPLSHKGRGGVVVEHLTPRPSLHVVERGSLSVGGAVVTMRPSFFDPLRAPSLLSYRERPGELRMALLTGSLRAKERREVYAALEAGEIDIVCGTHAVIQGGVRFHDLGVAVVDEQHRFGVMQRAALREKGAQAAHTPHMLVMTATPIPRTLALTLYGDLDISVIDEMPPGRQPIKTTWVAPEERAEAERFVRAQVAAGRQAFVICPLVEESETLAVKSATAEYERLRRDVYPDLRLELLHGRMSGKQKDEVMRRFRDGTVDILVSTAVIEVGIDVANASVMMIEGADRFGMAQLHQFRGRVGRGAEQSYCLLLAEDPGEEAHKRLVLMEETNDGFRLAEADMQQRGPGQFFGTKQSGLPGLKVARLSDVKLIEQTRAEAERILDADSGLTAAEHRGLNVRVRGMLDAIVDEEH